MSTSRYSGGIVSKKANIVTGVVVGLVVIFALVSFFMAKNAGTKVDVAQVRTESLAVTVLGSGKVTAGAKVDVYPESSGLIEKIYAKDGAEVEKGDKILKLQTDALDAQLASAQSALAQAQSGLEQANFSATTKTQSVKAAKAGVSAAQEAYDAAQSAESAALSAYNAAKTNPTAKAAYTSAKVATAQAKSALAQAKLGYAQAKSTPTSGAQKAARKGVSAAQKSVELAQTALDKATLLASTSGTLMYPTASSATAMAAAATSSSATAKSNDNTPAKGAALAQGSPAFSIVDSKKLSFTVEVDEADIEKVKVGQSVKVTLDAFEGKTFNGQVLSIGQVAQTTSTGGTIFLVEMSLDQGTSALKLGMKGDSTIEVENVASALTVPIEALFSEGGKDYVYVVKNNKLVKTTITAGTTTDTSVEVLDGIKEGDTVALAGSAPLSDGLSVKVNTSKSNSK